MFNDPVQILGLVAGTLTTIAFVPQVIKTWRTRSARDLSLPMFMIFFSGTLAWLLYGVIRQDLPVIAANSVTLILSAMMLVFQWRFRD